MKLYRLKPNKTVKRAPGPGAMRRRDWEPIAKHDIQNKKVILHSDGARAYKMAVPGVVHDNVVHKKKLVKIGKKMVWVRPKFAKLVTHRLPGVRQPVKVKAGTQIIDRFWAHLRAHLKYCVRTPGSTALKNRVRSAQFTYWCKGEDMWAKTGEMIQTLSSTGQR